MKRIACGVALEALFLTGCHTITEELPTQPTKTPTSGILTVAIPSIPVATPTPKPTPKPTPTPVATPTPAPSPEATPTPPPSSSGCGNPLPPDVARMNTKIHLRGTTRWTLDTTPLVGPDGDFCRKIGFTDGRLFCPVRTEGASDRPACETYVVGNAKDTGRAGPTWYRDGRLCTGEGSGCENHPDNQYLLFVYTAGLYQACTRDGVCGEVRADR
jgi:hypothetical protein